MEGAIEMRAPGSASDGGRFTFVSYSSETDGSQEVECETLWLETTKQQSEQEQIANTDKNAYFSEHASRKKRIQAFRKLFQRVFGRTTGDRSSATDDDMMGLKDDLSLATTAASSLASISSQELEGFLVETNGTDQFDEVTLMDLLSVLEQSPGSTEVDKSSEGIAEGVEVTIQSEASSGLTKEDLKLLDTNQMSLMEQRLLKTGLVRRKDFEFVPDYVSKEVIHLYDEKKEDSYDPTQDENVAHVKTGIWEITRLKDNGTPEEPYYVVTGVSMDDRVDTKKLRKVVFAGQTNKRRPKLAMAPTSVAEELAGYVSGTMAPICHTKNMKLFLEEGLVENVDLNVHRLNVGSGMFGKCLSISAKKFMDIARANPEGIEVCSIIRKSKKKKSSSR